MSCIRLGDLLTRNFVFRCHPFARPLASPKPLMGSSTCSFQAFTTPMPTLGWPVLETSFMALDSWAFSVHSSRGQDLTFHTIGYWILDIGYWNLVRFGGGVRVCMYIEYNQLVNWESSNKRGRQSCGGSTK